MNFSFLKKMARDVTSCLACCLVSYLFFQLLCLFCNFHLRDEIYAQVFCFGIGCDKGCFLIGYFGLVYGL